MEEQEAEGELVENANVHISIFPHLNEFMVIDLRNEQQSQVRVIAAQELLAPQYYQEVKEEFARMLQSEGTPFLNLMVLPQRLEAHLRWKGMQQLYEMFRSNAPSTKEPRLSIFVCAGPVLAMTEQEISAAMEAFFRDRLPPSFIAACDATFQRLLGQEKSYIEKRERDELRRAVEGSSNQFYTLWQDTSGRGFSPQ